MNVLLAASRLYLPGFIRENRLSELFTATADAFRCPAPNLPGLSAEEHLKAYAMFAAAHAREAITRHQAREARKRLFQNARRIGEALRAELGVHTEAELLLASRVIYKALRIDFRGEPGGQVVIPRCFFSRYFSAGVCQVASGLDEGLLAGLSGGRVLEFSARITEGAPCCRAHLGEAGD